MLIYQLSRPQKYQSDCELEHALYVLWKIETKLVFASDAEQCGDKLAFTEGPTILFLIDTPHSGETVLQGDHINLNVWECYIMDKYHNPLDLTAFWILLFHVLFAL